jgi:hypothetical protein
LRNLGVLGGREEVVSNKLPKYPIRFLELSTINDFGPRGGWLKVCGLGDGFPSVLTKGPIIDTSGPFRNRGKVKVRLNDFLAKLNYLPMDLNRDLQRGTGSRNRFHLGKISIKSPHRWLMVPTTSGGKGNQIVGTDILTKGR